MTKLRLNLHPLNFLNTHKYNQRDESRRNQPNR